MSTVWIEAIVVGVALAPCILVAMRLVDPRSAVQVLLVSAIVGCLFHLACEALGINRWYCSHGAACGR